VLWIEITPLHTANMVLTLCGFFSESDIAKAVKYGYGRIW